MVFKFKSYQNFKKKLGEANSIVALNELAVRDFKYRANSSEQGASEYIAEKSTQFNICVNFDKFPDFSVDLAQRYIVSIYEGTEEFYNNFIKEYQSFKQKLNDNELTLEAKEENTNKDKKKTLADVLKLLDKNYIKNCNNWEFYNSGERLIGKIPMSIYVYYTEIRHRVIHPYDKKVKELNNARSRLISFRSEIQESYKVPDIPNEFEQIDFEDFVLFSRVVKDIALKLSQIGCPTDKELIDLVGRNKKIGKFKNNPKAWRRALVGEICCIYGVDRKEAYDIIDRVLGSLA